MPMPNPIRVRDGTYSLLARLARKLQNLLGRSALIDEGMSQLLCKEDIMNLAGSWDLSNEEAEMLKKNIEELWSA